MSHENCVCLDGWRIDATELGTGQVKAVLHCSSAEWEDVYSGVGKGQLLTSSREPSAQDIFPHDTGVYISRILNTDGDRDVLWGGMVEAFTGIGDTAIGLQSLNEYLNHRYVSLEDGSGGMTVDWVDAPIQQIAYDLVVLALPRGIQLFPVIEVNGPPIRLDHHWDWWEFKNIGAALAELVDLGLRWRLRHEYSNGFYQSFIVFDTDLGTVRDRVLKSDREVYRFALEVNASDQTTRAFTIGEGEEAAQKLAIAYDEAATGPEWQATPAFKDVSMQGTLDAYARAHIASFRDPIATPSLTLAGLEIAPEDLLEGDITPVDLGFGVSTFVGQAQVLSIAWRVNTGDEPLIRNVALLPLIRSSLSVKTQVPIIPPAPAPIPAPVTPPVVQPPPGADPDPKPGLLFKIKDGVITESSYGQYSIKTGGMYWTGNDEGKNPQVYGYDVKTGNRMAAIRFDGVTLPSDPEALRMDPAGRLNLGDIGDNDNNRGNKYIYRWAETTKGNHTVTPNRYTVVYSIGSKNAECLMFDPRDGQPWIVTKEGSGQLLKGPASIGGGTNTFTKQSGVNMGKDVTDGTFTNSGKFALIRRKGATGTDVYRSSDWKKMGTISTPAVSKGESITMEPAGKSFLIGSEGTNSPVYRVILPKEYR